MAHTAVRRSHSGRHSVALVVSIIVLNFWLNLQIVSSNQPYCRHFEITLLCYAIVLIIIVYTEAKLKRSCSQEN